MRACSSVEPSFARACQIVPVKNQSISSARATLSACGSALLSRSAIRCTLKNDSCRNSAKRSVFLAVVSKARLSVDSTNRDVDRRRARSRSQTSIPCLKKE